ncbi:Facilitated trehalose transporter Tret1, partial [Armadillidium vulgare]
MQNTFALEVRSGWALITGIFRKVQITLTLHMLKRRSQCYNVRDEISIIVTLIQLGSLIVGASFIDRSGRKFLLTLSALFMFFALFFLGGYFYYQETRIEFANKIYWLPVISALIYITAFSNGCGPIPWLMMGELFSPEVKEVVGSISSFSNWTFGFIVTFVFGPLQNEVHIYGVFWIFAGICVLNLIFVLSCVYETKGKTLQEINDHFRGTYFN